ncbi:CoA pyrophosphatase [Alkalihalobacillus oceani]|uniref:NUDIX hydrolase n=1 Tax=Halalkalibacter oceani TaxID=1653776 RepID=UPI0020421A3A|nr:CoA pyrophosphatase [Halalkalibacter oceani]MCM3762335.1 CoA pyrophosphatase [Halalkalibacter oceani]
MRDLSEIEARLAGRSAGVIAQKDSLNAAVILPLVDIDGELSVLFEVRAHHLNSQPGEICFPGGRIDADDPTPQLAAMREVTEELGLKREYIKPLAPLDVLVTPFRGIIYPFAAVLENIESIKPNPAEVDHVFTVPLSFLYTHEPKRYEMNIHFEPDEHFPLEQISNSRTYAARKNTLTEFFYYYKQYVIWGLTARILTHFLELTRPD